MELQAYEIEQVIEGRFHEGNFVAIVLLRNGEIRGLLLKPTPLVDLSRLLQEALSRSSSDRAVEPPAAGSVAIDATSDTVSVARIEVWQPVDPQSPSRHGIFEIRLAGADGRGATFRLPHDEVVRWRDLLSEQIETFSKRHTNGVCDSSRCDMPLAIPAQRRIERLGEEPGRLVDSLPQLDLAPSCLGHDADDNFIVLWRHGPASDHSAAQAMSMRLEMWNVTRALFVVPSAMILYWSTGVLRLKRARNSLRP